MSDACIYYDCFFTSSLCYMFYSWYVLFWITRKVGNSNDTPSPFSFLLLFRLFTMYEAEEEKEGKVRKAISTSTRYSFYYLIICFLHLKSWKCILFFFPCSASTASKPIVETEQVQELVEVATWKKSWRDTFFSSCLFYIPQLNKLFVVFFPMLSIKLSLMLRRAFFSFGCIKYFLQQYKTVDGLVVFVNEYCFGKFSKIILVLLLGWACYWYSALYFQIL